MYLPRSPCHIQGISSSGFARLYRYILVQLCSIFNEKATVVFYAQPFYSYVKTDVYLPYTIILYVQNVSFFIYLFLKFKFFIHYFYSNFLFIFIYSPVYLFPTYLLL